MSIYQFIYGTDLAHAISHLKETTQLRIPLVVFGHMHKELTYGNGLRKMIVVGDDNTIYLNGAIVPRVKRLGNHQTANTQSSMNNKTSLSSPNAEDTVRAFTLVEISGGKLQKLGFLSLEMRPHCKRSTYCTGESMQAPRILCSEYGCPAVADAHLEMNTYL
ncbi:hypothetical protein RHGRI_000354 [Rhododendron griersonianum]|uniref:Calcineurin-like phosphoesterase domain-containing protein n=1 Tax=Rhododendron griersonianum TaxID=479676 RepID=A0AAV6LH67_9ERIC|nr:hypothetical protein RHGRI_000354 [Rhododendron griersonianum]